MQRPHICSTQQDAAGRRPRVLRSSRSLAKARCRTGFSQQRTAELVAAGGPFGGGGRGAAVAEKEAVAAEKNGGGGANTEDVGGGGGPGVGAVTDSSGGGPGFGAATDSGGGGPGVGAATESGGGGPGFCAATDSSGGGRAGCAVGGTNVPVMPARRSAVFIEHRHSCSQELSHVGSMLQEASVLTKDRCSCFCCSCSAAVIRE